MTEKEVLALFASLDRKKKAFLRGVVFSESATAAHEAAMLLEVFRAWPDSEVTDPR